jgi:type IV secretory pathway component VirB8
MEEEVLNVSEETQVQPYTETTGGRFTEDELQQMDYARAYLYSIGKWMKFFFVLMIICIAFMVIGGLCALVTSPLMGSLPDAGIDMPFWIFGVLYLACAVVYIFPALYMKRAANAADIAIHSNSNEAVVEFLKNNKSLWKFCGIFTIVSIALCILLIPIIAIIGIAAA